VYAAHDRPYASSSIRSMMPKQGVTYTRRFHDTIAYSSRITILSVHLYCCLLLLISILSFGSDQSRCFTIVRRITIYMTTSDYKSPNIFVRIILRRQPESNVENQNRVSLAFCSTILSSVDNTVVDIIF